MLTDQAIADSITARLELLERQRKQMLGLLGVLSVAVLALAGTSSLVRTPRIIEAESFVLKDRQGHVRARLGQGGDGEPTLAMLDRKGRNQLALHGSENDAAGLDLYNHGQVRASLWTAPGGSAAISFHDRNHRSSSVHYMLEDGSSGFAVGNERLGVEMAVQPDGIGGVCVAEQDGPEHGRLGALPAEAIYRSFYRGASTPPFRLAKAGGNRLNPLTENDTEARRPVPVPSLSPLETVSAATQDEVTPRRRFDDTNVDRPGNFLGSQTLLP